jgi:NAD(P)-dependent dehydrogenase (short-subunit alcohol dehydrogenase family)
MLNGKRILVTGASRGIGAAIARACHAYGAELALHYGSSRAQAEALAAEFDGAHLVQADLMDAQAPEQL